MLPKPSPDVVSRRLGDSAVLIRLSTNRIFELNATGARLWDLLQQPFDRDGLVDMDGLVAVLSREFDGPEDTIRADAEALLRSLTVEGLVVHQ